jgi:hypothetical protein
MHTILITLEFVISFCPSYITAQEASVAPKVSATKQVIQINGLTFGSSPITRARNSNNHVTIFSSFQHGSETHLAGEGGGDYYTTSC